ncbi:hypothetical protein FRUB_07965 [Fimbriiglobus ruber]|uniref:HNH nuclease domain-containing protein n=1 Tax=Fimbriiglobus ruber TaxID=1908690 RepID=A0A225D7H1_9BACT|nr:hypothetical protein FRUB_07965 [Fimbriiglobus ruber]
MSPRSGTHEDGYLQAEIDGTVYPADQLAWLIMTGEWPAHEIVHADGNKLNNSWNNIKEKAPLAKAA